MTTKLKKMTARYPGTCKNCGGPIAQGEDIEWSRSFGAQHVDCKGKYDAAAHAEDTAFRQREEYQEHRGVSPYGPETPYGGLIGQEPY